MAKTGLSRRVAADILREEFQMDGAPPSSLSTVFEREPMPLARFIVEQVKHPPLSELQFDFLHHLERIFLPDTYIAMVEEFGEDWIPARDVHMMTLVWGKGSIALSYNTPMYNALTGRWHSLKEFTSDGFVASVAKEDGKVLTHSASAAFKEGEGEIYRVKTAKGREIDVWEGHRFLTQRRTPGGGLVTQRIGGVQTPVAPVWTRLWDLKVGDRVGVATVVPEPIEVVRDVPDEHVELVAFQIANGALTGQNHGQVTWGEQSPLSVARTEELFNSFPETQVVTRTLAYEDTKRVHVIPKQVGSEYSVQLQDGVQTRLKHSDAVRTFAKWYGLTEHPAWEKVVPEKFFSLDNRQVALFISRLIDSDGWVTYTNTPEIGYATTSPVLAEQLCQLLLRLGVLAEKKIKSPQYQGGKTGRPAYQIRVRDVRSVLQLGSVLTLLDKQEVLDAVLAQCRGQRQNRLHGDVLFDKIVSIEPLGQDEYWTITVDGPESYISSGGVVNHNSGKDSMCRLGVMRVADLLNSLESPQAYYGLPEQDDIHLLNVASSTDQARRAFFSPMRRMFQINPHMMSMLRGNPPGEMATEIRLAKNIELVSGNSDAETQEGLNILIGIADEISAFKTIQELARAGIAAEGRAKKTADGIVKMMRTSARSRFPDSFKVVQISYPRFKGDAIMQAAARARDEAKRAEMEGRPSAHYLSGPHPTWKVNPRVTKENFQEDYDDDPVMAATMYECKPSSSVNRYMRDDARINEAFERSIPDPISVEYYWGLPENKLNNELAGEEMPGWQVRFHFNDHVLRPMRGARYAVHGDLSIVGDRAGVAMSHVRTYKTFQVETGRPADRRPVVKVDFVFSFEAKLNAVNPSGQKAPREVQIRWYRQLIWELRTRGFRIHSATFDGFQSADMIQLLRARGIEAKKVSLDVVQSPVYSTLKDIIDDGRLDAYYRQRVVDEIKGLTKMPSGKIDHPAGSSKDEADALGGSVYGAIQVGGTEGNSPTSVGDRASLQMAVPAAAGGTVGAFGSATDLMGLGAFGGSDYGSNLGFFGGGGMRHG